MDYGLSILRNAQPPALTGWTATNVTVVSHNSMTAFKLISGSQLVQTILATQVKNDTERYRIRVKFKHTVATTLSMLSTIEVKFKYSDGQYKNARIFLNRGAANSSDSVFYCDAYVEPRVNKFLTDITFTVRAGAITGELYIYSIEFAGSLPPAPGAGTVGSDQIADGTIKNSHFDRVSADKIIIGTADIGDATITNAKIDRVTADRLVVERADIKHGAIGTAQIEDAQITVAKIQNAFVDSLVATQGKFQSAHIGVLTSDNLSASTITAEYIKAVVIEAINLNVSGKINAARIDVTNLVVDNIDAGKITTGTLSAARIGANSIDASKLTVGDMTNLATLYQSTTNPDVEFTITGRDNKVCPGYLPIVDVEDSSEFMFDLYCQTFDDTTTIQLNAMIFVTYSDGTTSYHATRIATADEARTWVKKSVIVKVAFTPGKTPVNYLPVLQIPESPVNYTTNNWKVKQVVVRRKNAGKLLVDGVIETRHLKAGLITADKIDANAITAELLKVNVIQAINLTTQQIDSKNINTDNLTVNGSLIAGDISADNIKAQVIAAINSYTGTARIKQAQIETLKVGNANIIDLDASKINAGKISAQYIDATNLQIASGNVTGTFTASKISGGTLDASTMTVTNLRAESITTGALTIDGDNLIHNSDFLSGNKGWSFASFSAIDSTKKYDTSNTLRVIKSGVVTDNWGGAYGEFVEATAGQKFVTSVYCSTDDHTTLDSNIGLDIYAYRADGTIINNAFAFTRTKPTSNNTWIRMIASGTCPAETAKIRMYMWVQKNGRVWFARPMLQRGGIVSEWKPHVDEQISSEAITNDKIANEAITSGKLNIQELFVGSNAFINQLKAFEINAAQITTGKISGERIELAGLISFEALDTNLQPIFDTTGNKVYINGGMIAANSITAQSIDLKSGLTVTGPDNMITFAIASDGTVTANALLRSGNFDEAKQTGYKLSPDGTAILNQALVRGDVVLPNAGMTNFGGQIGNDNLLLNSDFSLTTSWGFGSGASYLASGGYNGDNAVLLNRTNWVTGQPRQQASQNVLLTDFAGLDKLTFSCWMFIDESSPTFTSNTNIGMRFKRTTGTTTDMTFILLSTVERGKWVYVTGTTTIPQDFDAAQVHTLLMSLEQNGTIKISRVKLEGGEAATPWCPAKSEQFNYTRMWAGSSFDGRNNAPFRVMQNGDVYAKNAILEGILYGRVDSGFVNIDQKQLSIVDDTSVPSKEYVRMNDLIALFDVDVLIGNEADKMVDINRTSRSLITTDTEVLFKGAQTNVGFSSVVGDYGGLSLIGVVSEGKHTIRHSSVASRLGTLVFDSQGARSEESDFSFTRNNYTDDVTVLVDGVLKVKKDIKSTVHNIEMRSVPGEGWGFYAG